MWPCVTLRRRMRRRGSSSSSRWSDVVAEPEAASARSHLGHRLLFPKDQAAAGSAPRWRRCGRCCLRPLRRSLRCSLWVKTHRSRRQCTRRCSAPTWCARTLPARRRRLSPAPVLPACPADLMQDLGYAHQDAGIRGCLLSSLAPVRDGCEEVEVARMLSMMARTRSGLQDHNSAGVRGLPRLQRRVPAPDEEQTRRPTQALPGN